MEESEENEF